MRLASHHQRDENGSFVVRRSSFVVFSKEDKKSFHLAFWLTLYLLSVYLLTFSTQPPTLNDLAALSMVNNLALRGQPEINSLIWTTQTTAISPGRWTDDGNFVPNHSPGSALALIPILQLGRILPGINAVHFVLLMNSLFAALAGGLMFLWLRDRDFSRRGAVVTVAVYGLCTPAWLGTHRVGGEALVALLLVIGFCVGERLSRRSWLGRWPQGLLLLVTLIYALSLTLAALRLPPNRWDWLPLTYLPILPLAIVYLATSLVALSKLKAIPALPFLWLAAAILALIGFGRNLQFLFGPSALVQPPWLDPSAETRPVLHLLLPPLILLFLTIVNLGSLLRSDERQARSYVSPLVAALLAVFLVGQMLLSTDHLDLKNSQARADQKIFDTLAGMLGPTDALFVPLPAPADAEAFSTHLIAYQHRPLTAYVWLAGKEISPINWSRIWQSTSRQANRVWLLERPLRTTDPLGQTAATLNADMFLIEGIRLDEITKLSLYALPDLAPTPDSVDIPFQAGLTLLSFDVLSQPPAPGGLLKLSLVWQMADEPDGPVPPRIVAFAHLLDDARSDRAVTQRDQLLVNLVESHQSPLLPGQIVQQGYALQLPDDLQPGSYSLIVGLYDAETVQRLTRVDSSPDDFLYLTTVIVTE